MTFNFTKVEPKVVPKNQSGGSNPAFANNLTTPWTYAHAKDYKDSAKDNPFMSHAQPAAAKQFGANSTKDQPSYNPF